MMMTNNNYIDFLKYTIETSQRELCRVLTNLREAEARGKRINESLRESVDMAIPTPEEIIGK